MCENAGAEVCVAESHSNQDPSLAGIAGAFLKLGTIAFGGPAAHVAMMEEEFVRRRGWLTEAEFLDRLAAANLIPGPSSTELAIFVGYMKRGWRGLIVAGCCFIIPAALIVLAIAWAYVRYGSLPQVSSMLYAVKPVVVAVVLQALVKLAGSALRTPFLWVLGVLAMVASAAGVGPILILLLAGGVAASSSWARGRRLASIAIYPAKLLAGIAAVAAVIPAVPAGLLRLFLSFLKVGSVVFGSGYVLLAFLRSEFVEHLHWLSERQLLDAVAVGQFTPGPLFTTATFIGYLVAGWPGALVATAGIFLPGFVLVAACGSLIPRLRNNRLVASALDGVAAGSIALMAVVTWQLAEAALTDRFSAVMFLAAVVALRFRVNSALLVAAGAATGWLAGVFH